MKLSTMFFILTPFGFFCTENGTGLITGSVFLIIGIILKCVERNRWMLSLNFVCKIYEI